MNSSQKKLNLIEALRFVAASMVVLFHTTSIFEQHFDIRPFADIFRYGFRGVDLFFVLSGFIINYVHFSDVGKPQRLENYLFNRLSRVYPAIIIMTVFAAAAYLTGFGGGDKAGKLTLGNFLTSALLLPQENARQGAALVNVSWTLKYEIFFYLLYAIAIVERRVGIAALVIWQLATLVFSQLDGGSDLDIFSFYLSPLCLDFSVGIFTAWLLLRAERLPVLQRPPSQWALLISGITLFVGAMLIEPYTGSAGIAYALGSAAMILGLALLESFGGRTVPPFAARLGRASYSIYLVHYSVISIVTVLLAHAHVTAGSLVALAAAATGIVSGIAFDGFIDHPIQKWLRTHLKPRLLAGTPGFRAASGTTER